MRWHPTFSPICREKTPERILPRRSAPFFPRRAVFYHLRCHARFDNTAAVSRSAVRSSRKGRFTAGRRRGVDAGGGADARFYHAFSVLRQDVAVHGDKEFCRRHTYNTRCCAGVAVGIRGCMLAQVVSSAVAAAACIFSAARLGAFINVRRLVLPFLRRRRTVCRWSYVADCSIFPLPLRR